ncbi:MAG: hypothetical protein IPF66_16595 [Holophagales bacterium]|nr:hypothetical protein [Holophagales bacterium]
MCHPVRCQRCGKPTWAGCGRHVEEALANVPKAQRCDCPPEASFIRRLFSQSGK